MIRDATLDFIKNEGIEYYKKFIRETIEDGRRAFIARIKQLLVPGRYRASSFMGNTSEPHSVETTGNHSSIVEYAARACS